MDNLKDSEKVLMDPLSSSGSSSIEDKEEEREHWGNKCDSILSFLGYAVGLGNLWRFPYIAMKNGGGAFLIPFLTVLTLCGLPLYFMELCLGQFCGRGATHCWEVCPVVKGMGVGMVICTSIIVFYYNIILAWCLYYLGSSFANPLPWTTCNNEWNTDHCITDHEKNKAQNNSITSFNYTFFNQSDYNITGSAEYTWNDTLHDQNTTLFVYKKPITSVEEFWQFKTLQISSGIEEVGTIPWHLALCFIGAWILVYLCLCKGIRSVGKVVYVTATLPYLLLIAFLVRGVMLPGAMDGIIYYIKPDWHKIFRFQVWVEATVQVFYSLGPGWGPMITFASYNKFKNNCLKDSVLLTFMSEGTSILGGFVVAGILGFMAHEAGTHVSQIVKAGPGLGFVVYPEAISLLPVANLWSVLFFLMLLTVGLDSQFVHIEALLTALTDTYPRLRKRRALFTGAVCILFFLVGLLICTQGGIYIFQLVDWYIASIALPVFGLLECFVFAWIYGTERFSEDIRVMLGRGVPVFMRICWCIITPAVLLCLLIMILVTYQPPTYGSYNYPSYCNAIGVLFALVPLVPIPVFAVKVIRNMDGDGWLEKIKNSFRPSEEWKPCCKSAAHVHYSKEEVEYDNVWQFLKINLCGKRH